MSLYFFFLALAVINVFLNTSGDKNDKAALLKSLYQLYQLCDIKCKQVLDNMNQTLRVDVSNFHYLGPLLELFVKVESKTVNRPSST